MSELTFKIFNQQLRELYRAKEYAQAFELAEREQATFPEKAREVSYWRLCLHALLNKPTESLHILREALERGDWYPPNWLKQDPDLVSLLPLPEFQEMIEICQQRLADLQGSSSPELLVAKPAEQTVALPLLIALHGNGSNARDTVDHWSGITTHSWLLAVPQSSQIVGPEAFVWDERETGISEAREHLAALSSEYAVDPERVVLGGFSMGGGQAIWMALHQSIKARGFVVLGPYLTAAELEALPALFASQKPTGLRGSILVGDEDVECLEVSRKVVEIMRAHDLSCELEVRPGLDHTYPADFVEVLARGLAFIEQA